MSGLPHERQIMGEKMSDAYAKMDEAIAWIMHSQGCSREKARELLREAIATGRVRATGVRSDTGKREAIKPWKLQ